MLKLLLIRYLRTVIKCINECVTRLFCYRDHLLRLARARANNETYILINAQPYKMAALLRRVLCASSPRGYCLSRITKPVSVNKTCLCKYTRLLPVLVCLYSNNLVCPVCVFCTAHYSNKGSSKVVEINDERGIGDYPVLPWVSAQDRSPYEWWDIQDRRNKEDPVC